MKHLVACSAVRSCRSIYSPTLTSKPLLLALPTVPVFPKCSYSLITKFQEPLVKSCLLPVKTPAIDVSRSLTKYSLRKGKRKTVKAVLKRFYRLDWGAWVRGKCGREKKIYKKSHNRRRRLRQHVFTNGKQSYLLDKMVTSYWRKPKHYVDDPYQPYHKREEFPLTRRKPFVPLQE